MAANPSGGAARRRRWHPAIWSAAAVLVLLPAVAMRAGAAGVHWTTSDFVAAALLLGTACGAYELATHRAGDAWARAGIAAAVLGALGMVWANLAVGLVGDGANPANLAFMGVVGVAVVGTLLARLRPAAMARAMLATAGVHVLVGVAAAALGAGAPQDDAPRVLGVTTFFALPWLLSAALFHLAARATATAAAR